MIIDEDISPIISIIIPVYNVENYIEECVNSLLNCKSNDLEIILIDDGSKDQSGQICDELKKRDIRVRVKHIENAGPGNARNQGINIARGKYLFFCDSDDFVDSNGFFKVIEFLKKNDLDILVFDSCYEGNCKGNYVFDAAEMNEKDPKNEVIKYATRIRISAPWKKIFRLEIVKKYNIKFPSNRILHEDLSFLFKYLEYINNAKIEKEPIYFHRYAENSLTRKNDVILFSNIADIYKDMEEFSEHCFVDSKDINYFKLRLLAILMGIIVRMLRQGVDEKKICNILEQEELFEKLCNVKPMTIKDIVRLCFFKFKKFQLYSKMYKK